MDENFIKDKVCLITGATSGHGKAMAEILSGMGADVTLLGRNREKCLKIQDEIKNRTGKKTDVLVCNLASQKDINRAATEFLNTKKSLHLLVNNAGIVNKKMKLSPDGIEEGFAVNYLAPFQLTLRLLNRIKDSVPARIVNICSDIHRIAKIDLEDLDFKKKKYSWMRSYGRSKLALVYFTIELSKRLYGTGITVNTVDPGPINSNIVGNEKGVAAAITRFIMKLFFPKPKKAARTAIILSTSGEMDNITGKYYRFGKEKPPKLIYDGDFIKKLWKMSVEISGVDI